MYKDENGRAIKLSPGQDFIYRSIAMKNVPRNHIMCHTRFGKSMTVALAVLTRCVTYPEKWAIISGQKEKAKIIMDYIISHIFDNEFTQNRFLPDKGESIDDIRRYKSKNRLTFVINPEEKDPTKKLYSEIFIGSASDALGFGAPNVVEDEAGLIDDKDHALVMRMLGDDPHKNFLVKIGNPFKRNHFLRSYHDSAYRIINIDCYTSLKEGRISQQTIDEMRKEAFFSILYENKFPSASEIDESGYMNLLVEADLKAAQERIVEPVGAPRLGLDVAKGGRNWNVCSIRGDNWAKIIWRNKEENSVKIADKLQETMKQYNVAPQNVFIDDTGVGHGVVSVMKDRGLKVNAVNNGDKARDPKMLNVRAECYAGKNGVMAWIKQFGRLEPSEMWNELLRVKYKKDIGGRTKIMPKEDMIKQGLESPDVADSLALTFAKQKNSVYTNNSFINPRAVLDGDNPRPWGGVEPLIDGLIA
ncbi:MAG: hypothetical protein KGI08_01900 [Thaumarchaeota archaeon]|nr:hypothetical protein [Nitrososphaerota archaeon]